MNAFITVLLFSVLFGAVLYILTTWLLKKFGKEKKGKRTKHILVWRISLSLILLYVFAVLLLNRNTLDFLMAGPADFLLSSFLFVFFVSLAEVAIIDLLLPDVLRLRYRILLEVVIFFLIFVSSVIFFFVF